MSKTDAQAFVLLSEMVNKGYTIQFSTFGSNEFEVTVWTIPSNKDHHHYQGASLLEAVMKAYEKSI